MTAWCERIVPSEYCFTLEVTKSLHVGNDILSNPGVTHSVPITFIVMNVVGTEWVTPVSPRMRERLRMVKYLMSLVHELIALMGISMQVNPNLPE